MFDNNGPVHAVNKLRDFYAEHNAGMSGALKEKVRSASQELSPVDAVVKGMETLYAAVREDVFSGAATLQTLGVLATAVANGQFHSKGQRAWEIAAWTAQQIAPVEGVTVAEPDVDPGYTFVQPETPAEPVGTA